MLTVISTDMGYSYELHMVSIVPAYCDIYSYELHIVSIVHSYCDIYSYELHMVSNVPAYVCVLLLP